MLDSFTNAHRIIASAAFIGIVIASAAPSTAQTHPSFTQPTASTTGASSNDQREYEAVVPVVRGWYKGQISLYLSTDSSQQSVSRLTHTNFVPKLAGAITGKAVDDIYQLTNFKQGNILPSSPLPGGPENTDLNYTPLWQLSLVTWVAGQPHILKSEEDVKAQLAAGNVRVVKTNIVINCPVIYTPSGGLLYGVRIVR